METPELKKQNVLLDPYLESIFSNIFTPEVLDKIFANLQNNLSPRDTPLVNPIKESVIKDLSYYIGKVGERAGWKYEKTRNLLNKLDEIYPIAAFSLILREIAVDRDSQYVDHIEDSPEIFAITVLDGTIVQLDKRTIQNYRNFAAFRTIADAKIACRILSPIMKDLFRNGNKGQ